LFGSIPFLVAARFTKGGICMGRKRGLPLEKGTAGKLLSIMVSPTMYCSQRNKGREAFA